MIPHFVIKNPMNKTRATGKVFADEVTPEVLADVCLRITGQTDFTYEYVGNDYEDEFVPKSYNRGRTAVMLYQGTAAYVSFSERQIGGRNSSVQSVPTAFNRFQMNPYPQKRLYYYFLSAAGAATAYQMFIYRLMRTVGFAFLNDQETIGTTIQPFISAEDLMSGRKLNTGKNQSNNPTYLTKGSDGAVEVYGKTFGANKYETSLLCCALSVLCRASGTEARLYQVAEGDLAVLPAASQEVIRRMGRVQLIRTDMKLERAQFEKGGSLRSPRYMLNLFSKFGDKRCALCGCQVPELIQGAHVWPVSAIKKAPALTQEKRLAYALDGENGLWLCQNHHTLFDMKLIGIDDSGQVQIRPDLDPSSQAYIQEITTCWALPSKWLTGRFLWYLRQRIGTV